MKPLTLVMVYHEACEPVQVKKRLDIYISFWEARSACEPDTVST
jgi:hypothetical protein